MTTAADLDAIESHAALTPPARPDGAAVAMANLIGQCLGHANQSQRLMLMPSREAKLNGMIQREEVILRSLALVMDELLAMRGHRRCIEWRAVPENGAAKVVEGA